MVKLAVPFKRFNDVCDIADEFNIDFDPKQNSFEKLIDFIQEYSSKRINILYIGGIDMKTAKALSKIGDNVFFRLSASDTVAVQPLTESGCRFFFDSTMAVYNAPSLVSILDIGVTDVYIADDLWHRLKDTSSACKKHGVSIRAIANRIPSTCINRGKTPTDIILRPNDIDIIDGFVDTLEFDCFQNGGRNYDFAKMDVLYKTWFEKKNWNGDLREINDDLDFPLPNTTLFPQFTACKLNCDFRCAFGGKCNKCEQFRDLASFLSKKMLRIKL